MRRSTRTSAHPGFAPSIRAGRAPRASGIFLPLCLALALLAPVAPAPAAAASPRRGVLPPHNPAHDLAPIPDFATRCAPGTLDNSPACARVALAALNRAHVLEHLAPLRLRLATFLRLSPAAQLLAVVNLERAARGLPPFGALSAPLDQLARIAAVADADPHLAGGAPAVAGVPVVTWAANWAGGTSNALASDYAWMYEDGPGGFNLNCPRAGGPGCWGHRDNILGRFPATPGACGPRRPVRLVMGAAAVRTADGASLTELFVALCAPKLPDPVVSWSALARRLEGRAR